mmetsp:Transcript_18022/g.55173  ORF Transcript_18022/g.55173 Transcript_18022/m.55173 type:complete len:316 (+) Transcript_18022:2217-3164(+)
MAHQQEQGEELARELSNVSSTRLSSLKELEAKLQVVQERLTAAEGKGELAQIVGVIDQLEGDVDAVLTQDLTSGKGAAKHFRKSLVTRLEAARQLATDLYEEQDWQLLEQDDDTKMADAVDTSVVDDSNAAEESKEHKEPANDDAEPEEEGPAQPEEDDTTVRIRYDEDTKGKEDESSEENVKEDDTDASKKALEAKLEAEATQHAEEWKRLHARLVALSKQKAAVCAEKRALRERLLEKLAELEAEERAVRERQRVLLCHRHRRNRLRAAAKHCNKKKSCKSNCCDTAMPRGVYVLQPTGFPVHYVPQRYHLFF